MSLSMNSSRERRTKRSSLRKWRRFLFVSVATAVLSRSEAYTNSQIQQLAQASSLAYLPLEAMSSSPYFEPSGLTALGQVVDPNTESGATVFADHPNNLLIVACRGSANPKNFGTNLKFNLVPATRLSLSKVPRDAMVHEGFQEASVGLWQKLGPPLLETLRRQPFETEIKEVIFTGHSLGAATAQLCAVHYSSTRMARDMRDAYLTPDIVTFGGPKLCNGSLARHLRWGALGDSEILHMVHPQDPVLANNKVLWSQLGMVDVGIEMTCDSERPHVYTRDDEERPTKSMFGVAWNILDHCKYMGVFVGPRMKPTGGGGGVGQNSPLGGSSFERNPVNPGLGIRSDQDRYRA